VLAVVFAIVGVIALGVHALRAEPGTESHRWIVVVPLLIVLVFVLQQWFMH
jgi:type IV secretory pathway VirB2 component (pilin)